MSAAVDRVVALSSLIVLSPLLLLLALLVKSTSPGPVVFRQVRIGQDGRPFEILKFRTMTVDAPSGAVNVSPTGDPRVTRVGRVLRHWYLDELLQLVNVLKGDMSLVGPRPETPEYVALYTPREREVFTVRPGLVGPSTLGFMDEGERLAGVVDPGAHYAAVLLHERVALDLTYVGRKSLLVDLRLLGRQAVALVRR